MKVGIVDADLIGRKKHRFPNLVCMKLSAYFKKQCDEVALLTSYGDIDNYDKVFIAKVFTDTPISKKILIKKNVTCNGTGFFYDKAIPLAPDIERIKPDYHLYDSWVNQQLDNGVSRNSLKYYLDYSIGYATRGCFRRCSFCVNRNSMGSFLHSNINDWVDKSRKKICLLDDNVLACKNWKTVFSQLGNIGKPFQFKQGLDERLLTHENLKVLVNSKLDGDLIFAFDNLEDKDIIIEKLKLLREYFPTKKNIKFYILCGYDRNNFYDRQFWIDDIHSVFKRVKILTDYGIKPYIMRHANYEGSPFRGTYINLASWCNQPNIFSKFSYPDYCTAKDDALKGDRQSSTYCYYQEFLPYITEEEKSIKFKKGQYNG